MMFTFCHCRWVVIHFVFFGKLFNSSLTYPAKHRLICKIIFVNISASPFCQWFAKSFGCEHFPTYGILTYVWYAVNWPSSHHHVVTRQEECLSLRNWKQRKVYVPLTHYTSIHCPHCCTPQSHCTTLIYLHKWGGVDKQFDWLSLY